MVTWYILAIPPAAALALAPFCRTWPRGPLLYAVIGYAVAAILTTATSVDPWVSGAYASWLLLWLLFAVLLPWMVRDRWRLVWQVAAGLGGVLAVVGIGEWLLYGGRASGLTGNPGFLGVYLMASLPVSVWLATTPTAMSDRKTGVLAQIRPEIAWFAISVILCLGLWVSGTRAAILGAVLGLLVTTYLAHTAWQARVSLLLAVCLVVSVFFLPGETRRDFSAAPVQHRNSMLQVSWEAFKAKPLTGWGPGAYIHADQAYAPDAPEAADNPHNLYVQEVVEKGVFALPTFVFMALLLWRLRREPVPLAVLVSLGVYGAFWMLSPHLLVWVVLVTGYTLRKEDVHVQNAQGVRRS